ncbi:gamma-glutamyltransferase family protein [Zavarzinia compransoris]|uniref:Gamma-glutamyltransferase n=1 Tax=Zavarzinia compransoris TaxID=1264899 RepID=A0A317EAG4_9PROT|nr:gamma-glutamyltransferase family protein [Zavarzinia compransoris]PWR22293.1 gamma-glutamyltransferase [Zavarzinia compransoris]TDP46943.1 gamma-glutamyltransferase 1 [Zavarzinia compransoris]
MRLASIIGLTLALVATGSHGQQASDRHAPEAGTGGAAPVQAGKARDFMVVAAHPLAAEAGRAILAEGGSAADALVAVQLVLGLVEPQSSGLGGGGFLLHWSAEAGRLITLDGRETAPAAAGPDLFLGADGKPLPFFAAVVGGRSVGTPATLRLLEEIHRRAGRLPFERLLAPAIALADAGFPVSPRLAALIAAEGERLKHDGEAARYFFAADGRPLAAGAVLRNPAYAETLRRIAEGGVDAFYSGEIADDIVARVTGDALNPGALAESDLENYKVIERNPVCAPAFGYDICGMGPPSSGGIAVIQILSLAEAGGLGALAPGSAAAWRVIGEASRLAFADRERWLADPAFFRVPANGLIAPGYLALRARLLDGTAAQGPVMPGPVPAGQPAQDSGHLAPLPGAGAGPDFPSTTQVVIRDAAGDVISYTGTIENGFGSRLMVRGFLLNNELTDFSFAAADAAGLAVANRVEGGKRPRSSMAPTIVFRDGRPVLAIGSPGGSRIIGFVAQALIGHLVWGQDPATALAAPHLLNRFGPFELEAGTAASDLAPGLQALGYRTEITDLNSGLAAIAIGPDGLSGAADPRREGAVAGQ